MTPSDGWSKLKKPMALGGEIGQIGFTHTLGKRSRPENLKAERRSMLRMRLARTPNFDLITHKARR